ncbi:MAG: type II/IV secretion system protein, partial [Actinomycetota bacterium]|nr:type II/IV secretion system protein [Actinomycetota bacterium]
MTETASAMQPTRVRRRIGELLVDDGVLTAEQLQEALRSAKVVDGRRERLGQTIARLGFTSADNVGRALARQLQLEYFSGDTLPIDDTLIARVPAGLAERHSLLPIGAEPDGTLVVACADPTNIVALDDVRLASGARRVRALVASVTVIEAALR